MEKSVTPGRLALWAAGILGVWIVYVLIGFALDFPDAMTANWIAWLVFAAIVGLLLIAGVAKAVQIGVRSSRE